MLETLLSKLFPPRLPAVEEMRERIINIETLRQDCLECGIVSKREKPYRDGIERHFAEEKIN